MFYCLLCKQLEVIKPNQFHPAISVDRMLPPYPSHSAGFKHRTAILPTLLYPCNYPLAKRGFFGIHWEAPCRERMSSQRIDWEGKGHEAEEWADVAAGLVVSVDDGDCQGIAGLVGLMEVHGKEVEGCEVIAQWLVRAGRKFW
jgi:hypothetical protein